MSRTGMIPPGTVVEKVDGRESHAVSMGFSEWLSYMHSEREFGDTSGSISDYDGFCGGAKTYRDALSLADHGWPEGQALVRSMTLPLVDHLVSETSLTGGWSWDVTGASFSVGEALNGSPECWLTPAARTVKPTVSIMLDAFLSSGVSTMALKLRGAAMVSLVLALESAGYAVQVSTAFGFDSSAVNGKTTWCRVVLTDDAGGQVDTDRLLFMLAHPAGTRWLLFTYGSLATGHDTTHHARECFRHTCSIPCPWEATLFVPRMVWGDKAYRWDDRAWVENWVRETFHNLTGV